MDPRRVTFWMLALAGVAVGHIVGYGLAHPETAAREAALGGHAYLPAAASVAIPLGVVAALVWAVRTGRQLGMAGRIPWRSLAAAQLALFAVQEFGERAVSGDPMTSLLTERGVWLGLLAQVGVAILVTRSVDAVRRVVRMVRPGARRLGDRLRVRMLFVPAATPHVARVSVAVGLRAPPVVSAPR